MPNKSSVMLLSGGMNSAVLALHMQKKRRFIREALIFDVATEIGREATFAKAMALRAGIPFSVWHFHNSPAFDLDALDLPDEDQPRDDYQMLRGTMLLTAAFKAKQRGCENIIVGYLSEELDMLVDDLYLFVGGVARLAGLKSIAFEFPFMSMSKSDVFDLARMNDHLVEVGYHTTSCLAGDTETLFSWGYGCGNCTGCMRRAAGWEIYVEGLKK
jgi:7-cyano-7-deazaguanine synthase in queuosine biosynthesis